MIEFEGVRKNYGSFHALRGLSFNIEKGEIFGLVGPNGAGKTSAIRLLCGALKPTSGRVLVKGMDVQKRGIDVKRIIGYLPEEPSLYEQMTPRQLLDFFSSIYGIENPKGRINLLLQQMGMLEKAEIKIKTFSKGMRQRIAICRALLHDPEILVLDEPTMGLDPITARELRGFISTLKGKKTVVLCTHYMQEAEELCDRVGILVGGNLAAVAGVRELKA